ncbi:hypothetical protein EVAR_12282_1 [Eumeta japonica]|uniref:Uncharacterized protein n=1 Tax=Eumeta variegata TaxID=151549 RepID=A0A4C1TU77_EUMVA|nr:hypothetical protein EVAR_12282_1 [Eumeta japonica]
MPEWKGRVPLTRSHCERITVAKRNSPHSSTDVNELSHNTDRARCACAASGRKSARSSNCALTRMQEEFALVDGF